MASLRQRHVQAPLDGAHALVAVAHYEDARGCGRKCGDLAGPVRVFGLDEDGTRMERETLLVARRLLEERGLGAKRDRASGGLPALSKTFAFTRIGPEVALLHL